MTSKPYDSPKLDPPEAFHDMHPHQSVDEIAEKNDVAHLLISLSPARDSKSSHITPNMKFSFNSPQNPSSQALWTSPIRGSTSLDFGTPLPFNSPSQTSLPYEMSPFSSYAANMLSPLTSSSSSSSSSSLLQPQLPPTSSAAFSSPSSSPFGVGASKEELSMQSPASLERGLEDILGFSPVPFAYATKLNEKEITGDRMRTKSVITPESQSRSTFSPSSDPTPWISVKVEPDRWGDRSEFSNVMRTINSKVKGMEDPVFTPSSELGEDFFDLPSPPLNGRFRDRKASSVLAAELSISQTPILSPPRTLKTNKIAKAPPPPSSKSNTDGLTPSVMTFANKSLPTATTTKKLASSTSCTVYATAPSSLSSVTSSLSSTGPSSDVAKPPPNKAKRMSPPAKAPAPKQPDRPPVVGPLGTGSQRRICNCKNSKCLKLYCDCFALNRYCAGCNCRDCNNDRSHEAERKDAMKIALEKNPNAFSSKISKTGGNAKCDQVVGCNCVKSKCLKKYCECFQGALYCGEKCKCLECENFKGSVPLQERKLKIRDNRMISEPFASKPVTTLKQDMEGEATPSTTANATAPVIAALAIPQSPLPGLQDHPPSSQKRFAVMTKNLLSCSPDTRPLVISIFHYLSDGDLHNASLVCKPWLATAFDPALWEYETALTPPDEQASTLLLYQSPQQLRSAKALK